MRHPRSRVAILWGAIGVLAAAALVLMPGSRAGQTAAQPQCLPAGYSGSSEAYIPCNRLLETVTVPAGSSGVTTQTDFSADEPYRLVVSGVVQENEPGYAGWNTDLFYCWGSTFSTCGNPPQSWSPGSNLRYSSNGKAPQPLSFFWVDRPAYSASHRYELPVLVGNSVDGWPTFVSGPLTFSDKPGYSGDQDSGTWTINIYGASTETVKFGVSLAAHKALSKPHHGIVRTSATGVGQMVVPTPEWRSEVSSTSAKGTLQFSKLKLGGPTVIDIDELTLRVKSGDFLTSLAAAVHLKLVVTKSAVKNCKVGSSASAAFFDGSKARRDDTFRLEVPSCRIDEFFENGQEHAKLAVVVQAPELQPPR